MYLTEITAAAFETWISQICGLEQNTSIVLPAAGTLGVVIVIAVGVTDTTVAGAEPN